MAESSASNIEEVIVWAIFSFYSV